MRAEMDWKPKAACRKFPPDWWFPEKRSGKDAIRICRECPVRVECGRDAIDRDERWAIAAGFKTGRVSQRNSLRLWLGMEIVEASRVCRKCKQPVRGRLLLCRTCRNEVPAAAALAHVSELRDAGMRLVDIAAAAPMPLNTLKVLVYGREGAPSEYMSAVGSERLLAIPIPVRVAS